MSAPAGPNGATASQTQATQSTVPASQSANTQSTSQSSQSQTMSGSQPSSTQPTSQPALAQIPDSVPRPRDARTMELLLLSQGVTAYEARVPLLLLDFAYRHTSSILSDALHMAQDPFLGASGSGQSKPSAAGGDPVVRSSAVQTAIASRLAYQFRGGGGATGGGGASKDWMLEMAKERNKVALPRVQANEWGVRLPSERFVLSGVNWGLKEVWTGDDDEEGSSDEDEDMDDAMGLTGANGTNGGDSMEGVETEDVGGDGVEGGTVEDIFGTDADAEMAEQ